MMKRGKSNIGNCGNNHLTNCNCFLCNRIRKNKWSKSDEKLLKDNYLTKTNNELVSILKKTKSSIMYNLSKLNLNGRGLNISNKDIINLYLNKKINIYEIGKIEDM